VDRRGLTGLFKVSLAGAVIVAGPWLVSIIGITTIQRLFIGRMDELPGAFMAVVIYSYAFSLLIGGGFHYIFTRIISDYLYVKDENAAFCYLLKALIPAALISLVLGIPAVLTLSPPLSHLWVFRAGALLLFLAVNLLWLIMLFISVLTWYLRILLSYIIGMAAALGLIYLLAGTYGTGGAVLGFALGHLVICLILLFLCFQSFTPEYRETMKGAFRKYFKKYMFLFFTGSLYYLSIWVDKMVNWIFHGTPVAGTFLAVYEPYDITVYFANLSMVPGLIYFVISTETDFYILLRKFLLSLGKGRFTDIQRRKYRLISRANRGIREQCIFQGLITTGLILAAPRLQIALLGGIVSLSVMGITLAAVFFHLTCLTLVNFLFYLEMYRRAFYATLTFAVVNTVVSLLSSLSSVTTLAGLGYLAGGIAGSAVAFIAFRASIRKMDRLVFTGLRY
ncbi:MAG: exopolysaccharide Pel transporter PelG, partial [Spirochaetales bacterium]|nr:exopolysaccharide Pel transporter PelG [Spirochaetales bacterium]